MYKNFGIIIIFLMMVFSCSNKNHIKSSDIKTTEEKISVLQKLFNLKTEIIDTEFDIFDVILNNRSIPGASSRDYKIIIKVKSENIEKWYEPNNITSFPINYEWAEKLLEDSKNEKLKIFGTNYQYKTKNKEMIIFKESGLILIRLSQL